MVRRLVMAALLSGTVAVLAAPAAAQVSPNNQPPPQVESLVVTRQVTPPAGPDVLGAQIEAAPAGPQVAGLTAQAPVSTLPLTGGDIAALAASGAGMLGAGALLVRRTRRR